MDEILEVDEGCENEDISFDDIGVGEEEDFNFRIPKGCCPVDQQYLVPLLPIGCEFRMLLHSNHSDKFFIGLRGIQLRDGYDNLIPIDPTRVNAVPTRDVNCLDELRGGGYIDPRTPDKLVVGDNSFWDEENSWLAPKDKFIPHTISLHFDVPIQLGQVLIWNYAKTPERGVNLFDLYLDDTIIFSGSLSKYQGEECDDYQTILFTDDSEVCEREKEGGHLMVGEEEENGSVLFLDEGVQLESQSQEIEKRPSTSVRKGSRRRNRHTG